jgi:thiol-disulfide isomerase/thioredoxin
MKKLLCTLLAGAMVLGATAQNDSLPQPPYKRFPTLPPFKLLLTDSVTWFSKEELPRKKTTLVVVFSPDCEHCKHETEEIISHIAEFSKVEIVMATPAPFEKMKEFYAHYDLQRFKNITVGRDTDFMFPVFYAMHNFPFLAFYDKKGRLTDAFEGSMPVEKVLQKLDE